MCVACIVASRLGIKLHGYMKEHKVNPMKNMIGPMTQVCVWFRGVGCHCGMFKFSHV